jgi:hypothetical protein
MKFTLSALLATTLVATGAFAPARATEQASDAWPTEAGAWRYAPPPAAAARPPEDLPAVEAVVDFLVRATDPASYRGPGTAGVAERGGGRYVFDVWLRGTHQHSLVLVLPARPDEVPAAWLVTRRVEQRIGIAELMRMVDRTLDLSRRDSAPPGTGITWRPLPPVPLPQATGKETTSSGGVRVAVGDATGDGKIPADGLAAVAGAARGEEKHFNGFVSRFAAGGRSAPPGPDPTRVDVKFPSLPQSGDSTTWVRVSQPHTTESVMLPRVGWEVLVNAAPGMPVGAVAARTPANPGTGAPGKPGLSVAPVAAIRR